MKHIRFIAFLLAFSMLICAFSACKEDSENSSQAESSVEVVSSQPESTEDSSETSTENSEMSSETSTENLETSDETSDESSETSDESSRDETSSDHNYCGGCLDLSEFEDDWMYEVDEETWDSFMRDTDNYYNVTVKITATYCPGRATYFKSDDDAIYIGTAGSSRFECLYIEGDNYYYGQNRTTVLIDDVKVYTQPLNGQTMADLVNYSDGDYDWIFGTILWDFSHIRYSLAEFDWRDNCYRYTKANGDMYEFHFEYGKLIKVICVREEFTRTYVYSDYGTTSATVPNRVREKVEAALAA